MKSFWRIFVCLFILMHSAVSQTPDSAFGYFPLHVGDIRQYTYSSDIGPSILYYFTETITNDTVAFNGHKYFKVTTIFSNANHRSPQFVRVDSVTANVYALSGAQETLTDSLRMQTGDHQGLIYCYNVAADAVLGHTAMVKSFRYSVISRHQLAYGFGKNYSYDESSGWPYSSTLVYAKIDGKEYGTLLPVNESVELSQDFTLEQNYPNPFNPSTAISYTLPHSGPVRLNVFDLLGRQVATLVDEYQAPGHHTARFDARGLASGLYIYRIQAGTWTATRKMQMVK